MRSKSLSHMLRRSIRRFTPGIVKSIDDLREEYPHYSFGKGTYGSPQIYSWGEEATLRIGSYCSIAKGVQILLGGEHRMDWVTTYPFSVYCKSAKHIIGHPKTKGDVIIGNDVWLGIESMILSGVTIGDGAVIGARTVVAKDVPPYAVCSGNPGCAVKMRFSDAVIEKLLSIEWWNWEAERIEKALPFLLSDDIERFIDAVEQKLI